jgi:hypothetical protein
MCYLHITNTYCKRKNYVFFSSCHVEQNYSIIGIIDIPVTASGIALLERKQQLTFRQNFALLHEICQIVRKVCFDPPKAAVYSALYLHPSCR